MLSIERTGEQPEIVRIDGASYELTRPSKLPLREKARYNRIRKRIEELEQLDDPNEADEREYDERLADLVRIALPGIPEDVVAALGTEQRLEVGGAFFVSAAKRRIAALEALLPPAVAGPSSSPAASGSTAGASASG